MVTDGRAALKSIVERIERLEEEKRAIAEDIKEVYAEAKSKGFVPKIIRKVVALRRQDAHEREEEEALLASYMAAIGMTPLERWAARQDRDGDGDAETTITVSTDGGPAASMTMDELRQSINAKFGGAR